MGLRVVATSSRTWEPGNPDHVAIVDAALRALLRMLRLVPGWDSPGDITIVHGAADGGDMLIDRRARGQGMRTEPHPLYSQDWDRVGRAAGPLRNIAMLDDERGCAYVLALRRGGETSKGTSQCMSEARRRGLPLLVLDYP
jgi:hypothetical protein